MARRVQPTDDSFVPENEPDVYVTRAAAGARLRHAKAQADHWAAEFERLKGQAQEKMGSATELRDETGEVIATWSNSKTSRFDQTAHKAANPECHALYTGQHPVRTFRVVPLPVEDPDDD